MRTCIAGLLLLFIPQFSAAQAPLVIPRLEGDIVFDGRSNEPAWEAIEPLPVTMQTPDFGQRPSERTEFRIAYDERYVYVAGRLYDSHPQGIRSTSLERDDPSMANDVFIVALDTYNDKESSLTFGTTPAGLRTDVAISGDGVTYNFSWNTFWAVETARDETGWFAVMRIPFSSLRFQERNGRVVMGIIIIRGIARKNELITFPAIPPKWGPNSMFKSSRAREVVFKGIHSRTPLYVTPYALGGLGQSFALNSAGTDYRRSDTPVYEAGLDLKYGITSNLTLDVTVNPDFAQVEADQQQVNLTRFSLFFPEKRLFFQERSSIFEFSLGGFNRLFYSRRIGLSRGEKVRIYGGARITGRAGRWDVGALTMQTAPSEYLPSENFGVVRLRRRVWNENSYVGGIATSRIGADGSYNVAYGLDGIFRLFGRDYLTLEWAQTFEDATGSMTGAFDRGFIRARWERRGVDGFTYALDVSRVGPAFHPGVGFILRNDYTRIGDKISYGWRPGAASPLLRHTLALNGSVYRRNVDGSIESLKLSPEWTFVLKSGHIFTVGAYTTYEDLIHPFALSPKVQIPAGSYRFHSGGISYIPSTSDLFRSGVTLRAGTFYDGRRMSVAFSPMWNISRHLRLSGGYEFNRVVFPDRDQRFNAHLARLRALFMLNVHLSASSFIQYNSLANVVTANLRFRYNPRPGTNLYIVYNHGVNTDRRRLVPALPFSTGRTLLVKYSRTLTLGL